MTYLGLDLTASEKRASAYAVLDNRGRLDVLGTLRSDQDIHQWGAEDRCVYDGNGLSTWSARGSVLPVGGLRLHSNYHS